MTLFTGERKGTKCPPSQSLRFLLSNSNIVFPTKAWKIRPMNWWIPPSNSTWLKCSTLSCVFDIWNKSSGFGNVKQRFESQCPLCCANLNKPFDLWLSSSCSVKQEGWIRTVIRLNLFRQGSSENPTGHCLRDSFLLLSGNISFLHPIQKKKNIPEHTCIHTHMHTHTHYIYSYI